MTQTEEELAASGLDWCALRSVKLTDGPRTGHVRVSDRFRVWLLGGGVSWWNDIRALRR